VEEQGTLSRSLKLGEHYICDLSDCEQALLFDSERSKRLFTQAVRSSGLTVVDEGFFQFNPHGFTCYLLLAESHASLHAWPEYGYCAIDLFTCNLRFDAEPLFNTIKDLFGAKSSSMRMIDRLALVEAQMLKERI
jgi:S-adenosylmethionine decarboxylase proenzyme